MRSLILLLLSALPTLAHPEENRHEIISQMIAASKSILTDLTPKQRATASLPFDSAERENWRYVPSNDRKGISLGALNEKQREQIFALVNTGLSHQGAVTVRQIIALEQYLAKKENNPIYRDPEKYYLTIFGIPAQKSIWGWRFEGHHLSLNFTIIEGETLVFTPAFFGTNPAEIMDGKIVKQRPLGEVEDHARAFTIEAAKKHPEVIFTEAPPKEILSRADRTAKGLKPIGLKGNNLEEPLRQKLQKAIDSIADHFAPTVVSGKIIDVSNASFAWGGETERGKPHYFRIQSPSVLIEYANTQNNANHAHLVIRFTENDFGRDLLKEHLEHSHRDD